MTKVEYHSILMSDHIFVLLSCCIAIYTIHIHKFSAVKLLLTTAALCCTHPRVL